MYTLLLLLLITTAASAHSNQCKTNNDCAENKACIQEKCTDPCVGVCGNNTYCKVTNHYPSCACNPGYTGDAFTHCKLQVPSLPQCKTNKDCTKDKACIQDQCTDPCVGLCGNNTECKVTNHTPSCECQSGYKGEPFTQCQPQCISSFMGAFGENKNKCYIRIAQPRSFHDASSYCQSLNMLLAAIENEEDNNQYLSEFPYGEDEYHWTSGHLENQPWKFNWMSTGEEVTYTRWRYEYPKGSGEQSDCIAVAKEGWKNYNCLDNLPFICQYY